MLSVYILFYLTLSCQYNALSLACFVLSMKIPPHFKLVQLEDTSLWLYVYVLTSLINQLCIKMHVEFFTSFIQWNIHVRKIQTTKYLLVDETPPSFKRSLQELFT